jgi:hypothetical protein
MGAQRIDVHLAACAAHRNLLPADNDETRCFDRSEFVGIGETIVIGNDDEFVTVIAVPAVHRWR